MRMLARFIRGLPAPAQPLAGAIALALCACGAAPSPVAAAPAPSATAPPAAVPVGDHALARSTVRAVVAGGLGMFLQHVEVDDQPVMTGGKFHGFRIASLRDPDF